MKVKSSKTNVRADLHLVRTGLAKDTKEAQAFIMSGRVFLGTEKILNASQKVPNTSLLEVQLPSKYVSRGGDKLAFAQENFQVKIQNRVFLDVGASTGGFTDCLLQAGAKYVFAIDVGHGQLDWKLRNDQRVGVLEKIHAGELKLSDLEKLSPLAHEITACCADVSFISLHKILKPLVENFPLIEDWLLLFKPQFEVASKWIGQGGMVRSQEAVVEALENFQNLLKTLNLKLEHLPLPSAILGKTSGNQEYWIHAKKGE